MSCLEELKKHREDILRRLKRAERADNSYEHNDHMLTSLETELERVDDELADLAEQAKAGTPLVTAEAFGGIVDAITANAARDRKQAGGK